MLYRLRLLPSVQISMMSQVVTHVWPSDDDEDNTADDPGGDVHRVDRVIG